jgi:hypothetical protein
MGLPLRVLLVMLAWPLADRPIHTLLTAEPGEHGLERGKQRRHTFGADDEVPQRLELLPSASVGHVTDGIRE